jgi:hypothetical protein
VVSTILAPHRVPQPRGQGEERGIHDGKATAAASRGVAREHRQQHEDPHLHEHDQASASVLAAMELEVQRSVDPGDPDQRKDDSELTERASRHMPGEVMGGLTDDSHVDQVVEQLEETDHTVGDHLAVRSRRSPPPTLEAAAERLLGHGVNVAKRRPTSGPGPTTSGTVASMGLLGTSTPVVATVGPIEGEAAVIHQGEHAWRSIQRSSTVRPAGMNAFPSRRRATVDRP